MKAKKIAASLVLMCMICAIPNSLFAQKNEPLESLVELAQDEVFYKGDSTNFEKVKIVEIGFVLAAKRDSIYKIVVRYTNLECSYYDAGYKTIRVRNSTNTYSMRCPLDKIAFGGNVLKYITDENGKTERAEWVKSDSITDLKFTDDGAAGTVKLSYSVRKEYGGEEIIPLGTATIHFKPVKNG